MRRGHYKGGFFRLCAGLAGHVCNPLLHRVFPQSTAPLTVREYTLNVRWWPPEANGYRIVFFSDLHLPAGLVGRQRLDELVNQVRLLRPDLLLSGGDFVNSLFSTANQNAEFYAAKLAELQAPDGIFAVLGNHDRKLDSKAVRAMLRAAGITELCNRCETIRIPGGQFHLAGLKDQCERKKQIKKVLPGPKCTDPIFAFTHNPDIFSLLPRRVKLLLAGHTHGGQVRLPWLGPVFPGCRNRRYCLGLIRESGKTLLVTGGIGCSTLDIRIGCPPEVMLLTLFAKGT